MQTYAQKPTRQSGGNIQAKLAVNAPGDAYEQEADRIADRVMRMPEPRLQRACACGGTCPKCRQKEEEQNVLQRKETGGDKSFHADVPSAVREELASSGQPMEATTGRFMESRFGHDFSRVRIHTGARAESAAKSIQAKAFTLGRDIVFGERAYAPDTTDGRRLLAHELTHVVQQSGGRTLQRAEGQIQRMGDQSQVPIGFSCPVAHDSSALPAVENIIFPVNSSTLGADGIAAVNNIVSNWQASGGNQPVRLDGYASPEGPDPLNWTLSCDRVTTVKNALVSPPGGGPGIPASYIEFFANGETSEFSSANPPNRRVTIKMNTGHPVPSRTNPTPTRVVPCSPTPAQIFTRGGCGRSTDTDFTYHDFQPLTGVSRSGRALVWQADNLSTDFRLRNDMRTELGLLGGSEGLRMVTHFSGGTGTTLTHNPSSPLGGDALVSGTFLRMHASVSRELERQLTAMDATGVIDCNTITLPTATVPTVNFTFADGYALKGIIGGTHGLRVQITHFAIDPATRHYDIGLQYLICDNFGVDTADLYSPGLAAFWVLQHRRAGYRPFINELDLPSTANGTY